MRKLLISTLATVVLAAGINCNTAGPATAQQGDVAIAMSGVLHPGAYEVFRSVVRRADPDLVVVSGPGGDLGTALRIATEIRRRGLSTAVPRGEYCASACAVIFLAGRTKYVAKGARLGLHSASNLDGSYSREGTLIMGRFLSGLGVPAGVIARMEKRHGSDMYWLGESDKRALKIVALSGSLPPAASAERTTRAQRATATRLAERRQPQTRQCGTGSAGAACYRMLPNGVIMKVQ
jgi:hypothetical protein